MTIIVRLFPWSLADGPRFQGYSCRSWGWLEWTCLEVGGLCIGRLHAEKLTREIWWSKRGETCKIETSANLILRDQWWSFVSKLSRAKDCCLQAYQARGLFWWNFAHRNSSRVPSFHFFFWGGLRANCSCSNFSSVLIKNH